MTTFILGLLLATVLAIAKEHADRQKTVKVLRFISASKPELVKELVVTKSWWQLIRERIKPIMLIVLGAALAWLVIQIVGA
jgi:hypothetical protein